MSQPRSPTLLAILGVWLLVMGFFFGYWAGEAGNSGPSAPPLDRKNELLAFSGPYWDAPAKSAPSRGTQPGGPAPSSGLAPMGADAASPGSSTPVTATTSAMSSAAAPAAPSPQARPARAEPPGPYSLPEKITGRLVDATTGKPIPGARLDLVWETSDGTIGSSNSIKIAADGSYSHEALSDMKFDIERMLGEGREFHGRYATPEAALADMEFGIRASATGYETLQKGQPGGEVDLALQPVSHAHLPGTVRVDAFWPDDSRFRGRLLVDAMGEDNAWFSQWSLSESDGSFLLPGVPAGPWKFRASGKNDSGTRAQVPEAGEVRVAVRVSKKGMKEAEGAPSGEPREVEVSTGGKDTGLGSFVRAEAREDLFFRVEVTASVALFPALPAGTWKFVLQVPDRPEVDFEAEVPAGAGRLTLRFP